MAKNKAAAEQLEEDFDTQGDQEVDNEANLAEELIRASFDEALAAETDEDGVKLNMIAAGATFKNVTRLYNKFMIDAGLAISKADRNQIVDDTLEGLDFETEDDFNAATKRIAEAVQGATERSAAALVRAYAKKVDLPCYAKPKSEGGSRTTFRSTYYDWLVANPDATKEQATAYVMGTGEYGATSENVQKHVSAHMGVFDLTQRIVAAVRG